MLHLLSSIRLIIARLIVKRRARFISLVELCRGCLLETSRAPPLGTAAFNEIQYGRKKNDVLAADIISMCYRIRRRTILMRYLRSRPPWNHKHARSLQLLHSIFTQGQTFLWI